MKEALHEEAGTKAGMNGETTTPGNADDVMMHLLHALYTAMATRERNEVAMAVLCKQFDIRMSTLQRHLTELEEHGLVTTHCDAAGRWTVGLTSYGWALFEMPGE